MIKKFVLNIIFISILQAMADWGYPEIDDVVILNTQNH